MHPGSAGASGLTPQAQGRRSSWASWPLWSSSRAAVPRCCERYTQGPSTLQAGTHPKPRGPELSAAAVLAVHPAAGASITAGTHVTPIALDGSARPPLAGGWCSDANAWAPTGRRTQQRSPAGDVPAPSGRRGASTPEQHCVPPTSPQRSQQQTKAGQSKAKPQQQPQQQQQQHQQRRSRGAGSHAAAPAQPRHSSLDERIERRLREARSLPQLRDVVLSESEPSDRFGPQHVTHALSRLAKLHREASSQCSAAAPRQQQQQQQQASQQQGPATAHLETARRLPGQRSATFNAQLVSSSVAPTLGRLSQLLLPAIPNLTPRQAAVCLWSLSCLDAYDRHTFDSLGSHLAQRPHLLQPCDCDMVMSAFARFNHYHPSLLRHIPDALLSQLGSAQAREVSTVMWAFAKLRIPHTPGKAFLEAAAQHVLRGAQGFTTQELATALWSLATLSHRPSIPWLSSMEKQLVDRAALLSPQDIGMALWAFGQLQYKAAALMDVLPLYNGRRLAQFKPLELSLMLAGYARARHYHASLLDAAAPVLLTRVRRLSHQDIIMALHTYSVFSHTPATTLSAGASTKAAREAGCNGAAADGASAWAAGLAGAGPGHVWRGAAADDSPWLQPSPKPNTGGSGSAGASLALHAQALGTAECAHQSSLAGQVEARIAAQGVRYASSPLQTPGTWCSNTAAQASHSPQRTQGSAQATLGSAQGSEAWWAWPNNTAAGERPAGPAGAATAATEAATEAAGSTTGSACPPTRRLHRGLLPTLSAAVHKRLQRMPPAVLCAAVKAVATAHARLGPDRGRQGAGRAPGIHVQGLQPRNLMHIRGRSGEVGSAARRLSRPLASAVSPWQGGDATDSSAHSTQLTLAASTDTSSGPATTSGTSHHTPSVSRPSGALSTGIAPPGQSGGQATGQGQGQGMLRRWGEPSRLAADAAWLACRRSVELRPRDVADLLYGLRLLHYTQPQVYYTCVRQLLRTLDEREQGQRGDRRPPDPRVLSSVVRSCMAVGLMPWPLIDWAGARGIRLQGLSQRLLVRRQQLRRRIQVLRNNRINSLLVLQQKVGTSPQQQQQQATASGSWQQSPAEVSQQPAQQPVQQLEQQPMQGSCQTAADGVVESGSAIQDQSWRRQHAPSAGGVDGSDANAGVLLSQPNVLGWASAEAGAQQSWQQWEEQLPSEALDPQAIGSDPSAQQLRQGSEAGPAVLHLLHSHGNGVSSLHTLTQARPLQASGAPRSAHGGGGSTHACISLGSFQADLEGGTGPVGLPPLSAVQGGAVTVGGAAAKKCNGVAAVEAGASAAAAAATPTSAWEAAISGSAIGATALQ